MNFECGSGKKGFLGSKINFKKKKKIFCKTILLAVRRVRKRYLVKMLTKHNIVLAINPVTSTKI